MEVVIDGIFTLRKDVRHIGPQSMSHSLCVSLLLQLDDIRRKDPKFKVTPKWKWKAARKEIHDFALFTDPSIASFGCSPRAG